MSGNEQLSGNEPRINGKKFGILLGERGYRVVPFQDRINYDEAEKLLHCSCNGTVFEQESYTRFRCTTCQREWHAHGKDFPKPQKVRARSLSDAAKCILDGFVSEILHGDAAHQEWLIKAATAYGEGEPVPKPEQPAKTPVNRIEIMEQGIEATRGSRQKTHGDWNENHEKIAELWSAFLGVKISAWQVCICMVLVKVARTVNGGFNLDDFVDGSVYMAGAGECLQKEGR